jgi:hypothetical protein
MASKKPGSAKKTAASAKKTRGTFTERFAKKIEKLGEWSEKMLPRFATAPKSDVSDALGVISENFVAIIEAVPKLNGWNPPTRSPAFAVGDSVTFKPKKIEELVKAGVYTKNELEGEHEIVAIAGRKVKLPIGLFQSLYVSKST